jgi:5-methylcytosine-specific restriction protein A
MGDGAMRQEFSRKVKNEALERCGGRCCSCGVTLTPATGTEFDHRIPDAVNGANSVANCSPLCSNCHGVKTKQDVKQIAKDKRARDKHSGAMTKTGKPMPGTKRSGWKHKMDGSWERR